ncbi:MAG: NfeD family protein [Chloroflexota bacterium]
MAPGTTIGAATPVASGGEEIPEDQLKKATEFSAKWMRTIAEERGRNMDEAELAVTESKSFTDSDALAANIIDLRADSLSHLLEQIDGTPIELASGRSMVLETADAAVQMRGMTLLERLLHTVTDPNVAYILFTLATIGLITEISSPGLIVPGVVGGICLILAFYALGVLDANFGGMVLMILAIGLFVAEYFTPTFGILTAGGVAALVVGSLILFSGTPGIQVDRGLIVGVAIGATAFSIFVVGAIIKGQRLQKSTGTEGMIGKIAVARTALRPRGTVLAEGELWTAEVKEGEASPGEELVIEGVERMLLRVRRPSQD